mgnify:CR=1 FL=1
MRMLYLIKPGEIELKLGNRREFIRRLKGHIHQRLAGIPHELEEYPGRFFLHVPREHAERVRFVLERCPGINGIASAIKTEKTPETIIRAVLETARAEVERGSKSFKIEVRRSDKSFPLDTYRMAVAAGDAVVEGIPELKVDVHNPDFIIMIEIRERAYVYSRTTPGPRGLPVGSQGKGLLLLSGGIDSPVAGCLMAKRGLALEAVYFHSYPYTSEEAQHKVEQLARRLAVWTGGITLWIVSFTEVQQRIKKGGNESANTLMLRMAMMQAADMIASRIGATALVTGESLGQVASQTAENMRLSQSPTSLPVFRPLIGIDKEDTIGMAKRMGTYEISILPNEDCCVLFSPKHPVLRPDFAGMKAYFASLELDGAIAEAVSASETKVFSFSEALSEFGWNEG